MVSKIEYKEEMSLKVSTLEFSFSVSKEKDSARYLVFIVEGRSLICKNLPIIEIIPSV